MSKPEAPGKSIPKYSCMQQEGRPLRIAPATGAGAENGNPPPSDGPTSEGASNDETKNVGDTSAGQSFQQESSPHAPEEGGAAHLDADLVNMPPPSDGPIPEAAAKDETISISDTSTEQHTCPQTTQDTSEDAELLILAWAWISDPLEAMVSVSRLQVKMRQALSVTRHLETTSSLKVLRPPRKTQELLSPTMTRKWPIAGGRIAAAIRHPQSSA